MSLPQTPTRSTAVGPDATKETPSKRVKLRDLTNKEKQSLMTQAVKLVAKGNPPKEGQYEEVEHEGNIYMVEHAIQYLHPAVRFDTMTTNIQGLAVGPPPMKPVKPSSNPKITRIFVGIAKDAARPKRWAKSKSFKVVAGGPCYMVIHDKKSGFCKGRP